MEEPRKDDQAVEKEVPKFRGLYRYVRISVPALNWIIGICIAVILVVFIIEMHDPGFTVKFDSKGGTDVASQNLMWGDKLEEPEPPVREGYTFTGWYADESYDTKWDFENRTVETDMTLYAGWQKK